MQKIIILGTSNALSSPGHANTHLVIVGTNRMVLIDVPGDAPIARLEKAGCDFDNLTDIIATHFHIDHTLGIPLLLMDMWLLGRQRPLNILGLQSTLDRVEKLLELYDWSEWPNMFPVTFLPIPNLELAPVMDCPDFSIHASPVHHGILNIGLRIQFKVTNHTVAYSCDTEPCDEVVRLSEGADILIHESAGEFPGHSSARQAGEIASKAGVGSLFLIHYATGKFAQDGLVNEALTAFNGEVGLAKDMMVFNFEKEE